MSTKKKESETYENMLQRVESIVQDIDRDDVALDQVISNVEEAYGLISKMRERLDQSKAKVEGLREKFENQGN